MQNHISSYTRRLDSSQMRLYAGYPSKSETAHLRTHLNSKIVQKRNLQASKTMRSSFSENSTRGSLYLTGFLSCKLLFLSNYLSTWIFKMSVYTATRKLSSRNPPKSSLESDCIYSHHIIINLQFYSKKGSRVSQVSSSICCR